MSAVRAEELTLKSPADKKSYRIVTMANGLQALLVHDPEIDLAAAAAQPAGPPPHAEVPSEEDVDSLLSGDESEDSGSEVRLRWGHGAGQRPALLQSPPLLHMWGGRWAHRPHGSLLAQIFQSWHHALQDDEEGSSGSEDGEEHEHVHRHHSRQAHGGGAAVKKAAAALSVGVGHFTDPWHLQASSYCGAARCCCLVANVAGACSRRTIAQQARGLVRLLQPFRASPPSAGPVALPGAHAVHGQRKVRLGGWWICCSAASMCLAWFLAWADWSPKPQATSRATVTCRYPDENDYDAFLTAHGGASNACTEEVWGAAKCRLRPESHIRLPAGCRRPERCKAINCSIACPPQECTTFHFDVKPDALRPALDRFAQFFIAPLVRAAADGWVCCGAAGLCQAAWLLWSPAEHPAAVMLLWPACSVSAPSEGPTPAACSGVLLIPVPFALPAHYLLAGQGGCAGAGGAGGGQRVFGSAAGGLCLPLVDRQGAPRAAH